jgi:hypothetical protein
MNRIKQNPYSTVLGILIIAYALSVPICIFNHIIPWYGFFVLLFIGILLLFAKDKLIDVLTLGLSRLIQDIILTLKKNKS